MLWFGLRKRFGRIQRVLRILQARLEALERVADPVKLRSVVLEATSALDAAQDKLNRVVERRRKQLWYEENEVADDEDQPDWLAIHAGQRPSPPEEEEDDSTEDLPADSR